MALDTVFARSDRIAGRRIAEECILLPIVSGGANLDSIDYLNRVGACIWKHLDGHTTGADVVAVLTVDEAIAAADDPTSSPSLSPSRPSARSTRERSQSCCHEFHGSSIQV